jgi:hypothetical protein
MSKGSKISLGQGTQQRQQAGHVSKPRHALISEGSISRFEGKCSNCSVQASRTEHPLDAFRKVKTVPTQMNLSKSTFLKT